MALIPVDPVVPETPLADFSCASPNPVKTVPLGSQDGRLRVQDPQSFATAIEEALRQMQAPGQDLTASNGMAAPTAPPAEPNQQDTDLFILPSPIAEAGTTDDTGPASSISRPEQARPQALPAFPAWMPVETETVAEELAPTPPPQTPGAPAASAAERPEPPGEPFFLDQGGEIPARLAVPAAEDPAFHLAGSAPEAQGSEPQPSLAPQAQTATTSPSDPSPPPADRAGYTSPDTGNPRLAVPADDSGAPGSFPSPDRRLTVSFAMRAEPLLKEPAAGPQDSVSPATEAETAAQESNRSRPAEGSAPKVPAPAALPHEEAAPGLFSAVAAAGRTPSEASETAPKARAVQGRPGEPLPPEEDTLAPSDPEQGADDAFQDGPTVDKTGEPKTASAAAPSARSPFQGRERALSQPGLAGAEETDPLQQAGVKPTEGRTEPPAGPGRSAPTPGPWRSESVMSHLQIHAREALETSAKQFHLRIQGDGLGEMRWDVRLEPGKIAAQALVDTIKLQELVQGQQDALVQRFQELGLEVEHFEVLVDSGSTGERFQGREASGSGSNLRKGAASPEERSLANAASRVTDRTLDLFV